MRVKICGIKDIKDIKTIIKADADAAGFLVGQLHASPDFILPSTANRLASKLPPYITPVIVTHLIMASQIFEVMTKTGVNTVQLHGGCPCSEVKILRDKAPLNSKFILAVHIVNQQVRPEIEDFYPLIDAVLLDSYNKSTGQVGGTGQPHDWKQSAELLKQCPLPIILAGGLDPDNVIEAIQTVKPFAVDANSGLKNKQGGRDPVRCQTFVANARAAAAQFKE